MQEKEQAGKKNDQISFKNIAIKVLDRCLIGVHVEVFHSSLDV